MPTQSERKPVNVEITSSGVKTSDVSIKASAGKVYWITVSDTLACVAQLNDSTNDSGTDKWQITMPIDSFAHYIFDPPLVFTLGIYLDIPTGSPDVILGYI